MTVPVFLNTTHRYLRLVGVTDVQTIINNLDTELEAASWTNPGAGLYQTPTDADGRWYDVLFTKIDADTLEIRVRDKLGVTVGTRRMDIDAAGTDVLILCGEMHCALEALRATPEYMYVTMIDMSPEAQTVHGAYIFFGASRTSAGAVDASHNYTRGYLLNLSTAAYVFVNAGEWVASGHADNASITVSGAYTFRPMMLHGTNVGNVGRQFGRCYQALLGESTLSPGTLYDVPIDTGVTAKFTIVGSAVNQTRMFVRAD